MESIFKIVQQAKDMINSLPDNTEWPYIVAVSDGHPRRILLSMMFMSKDNFVTVCGSAPASFSVKGASFLDDDTTHLTIYGFINMIHEQFKHQCGLPVGNPLWRDIPCDLNFIERCIITNGWVESTSSWLSPKCHKMGFHCRAHKLNKRLKFTLTRQLASGEKRGVIEVIDQN